jgi:Flp pilus assembly protein TadB
MTVVLGAVGTAALAAAGTIQARLLTADRIRARVGTRAASEALKGIVYQYLARVEPFSGSDRNANPADKVSEVERLAADHASLVAGAAPGARAVPHVNGVADYLRKRAEDQRNWHEQRTAKHKAQARHWRTAELIATGAAAVLAAVGGVWHGPNLSAWVAVATTAGAAFAAHLASQQHDRVADSYARTVLSLNDAIRRFAAESATKEEAAEFVANVEQVLAAHNDAWVGLFSAKSGA